MWKSKRLTKREIEKIWERKEEQYFLLGYHWDLYRLIKANPGITVKEICEAMPEYYKVVESEHNFTNCPDLYKDIDYLMNSSRIEKIIIKDNGTFRLGTEEECIEYANKLFIKGKRIMAKYGAISRRISRDGQGKLLGTNGAVISEESAARPFIETFVQKPTNMVSVY